MADRIDLAVPGEAADPLSAAIQALPVVKASDSSTTTIGEALQAALAAADDVAGAEPAFDTLDGGLI